AGQVALGHGGGHLGDRAHLVGGIGGQPVHVRRESLPRAGRPRDVGLTAETSLDADLTRHAGDLVREDCQRVRHAVDGVGQRVDLTLGFDGEALAQIAVGDRSHHFHDAAYLVGEVVRHYVHVVGEILPRAGDAGHQRLTTELAFGADLTRQAGHFRREAVELVHHRVDGLLQLQDLALHVHSDLARQVAACDGGRHFGDIAHLTGSVARRRGDVIGQVLPGTGDSRHDGLATQFALGTHLAGHARHFGGEAVELIDHRIDGLLQLQDLAAHVHGDLARQVAACDGGRHFGDIADLTGQIARHRVDLVGEILPHAADVLHLRLTAQLAFGTDLARHARHFRREAVELVAHRVDGLLQLQDLALHIRRDLARQVAARDGGGDFRDVTDLAGEVTGHGVHVVGQILPGTGDSRHHGLAAELAFGTHFARHTRHFRRE